MFEREERRERFESQSSRKLQFHSEFGVFGKFSSFQIFSMQSADSAADESYITERKCGSALRPQPKPFACPPWATASAATSLTLSCSASSAKQAQVQSYCMHHQTASIGVFRTSAAIHTYLELSHCITQQSGGEH